MLSSVKIINFDANMIRAKFMNKKSGNAINRTSWKSWYCFMCLLGFFVYLIFSHGTEEEQKRDELHGNLKTQVESSKGFCIEPMALDLCDILQA